MRKELETLTTIYGVMWFITLHILVISLSLTILFGEEIYARITMVSAVWCAFSFILNAIFSKLKEGVGD